MISTMFATVTNTGATLTIGAGVNVIVNGIFYNNGTIYNNGYLEVNAPFYGNAIIGDGVFNNEYVSGCTDTYACNYEESATFNDGTCLYIEEESVPGDITLDGTIDIIDIVALIILIIDINTEDYIPDCNELFFSDINQDGILNVIDVVGLVNIILDN